MSNAIATRGQTSLQPAQDREALEIRVALNSNLWGMQDDQVWLYYRWMAERLGLDPMSHPFDVITDAKQQTRKLYANSGCTSQLGEKHRISYGEMKIDANESLIKLGFKVAHVSVKATAPNGRFLVAEAFVDLMSGYEGKPLAGNNLVNALKKAGTQCRRRATLQLLGLAVPTEEIPTIKLGEMEQVGDYVEGVTIEHPPMEALQPAPEPVAAPPNGEEAFINSQLLAYCVAEKGNKNAQAYFNAKFANLPLAQRQAEAAKLGLLNPTEAPAQSATRRTRRGLVFEMISELQAKGISNEAIVDRTSSLCNGQTVIADLSDAEVETVIEDFSMWLDGLTQ